MIQAGTLSQAVPESGQWVIVDLGFAKASNKSCGLWVEGEDEKAKTLNFAGLCERVVELAKTAGEPLNLVLEAPLSVAFDDEGNPLGREIERLVSGETRFWYVGLGASVMLSAAYLLKQVAESSPVREVRLFEGFMSFKPKGKSNHVQDVEALRKVIFETEAKTKNGSIEMLETAESKGKLISAFDVFGMSWEIPPVVFVDSETA